MTDRLPGYYWIKIKGVYSNWEPAYFSTNGYWLVISSTQKFTETYVEEVGPKLERPHD